jgi:phospholipase C
MLLFALSVLSLCEARPIDNVEHIIIFMQENRWVTQPLRSKTIINKHVIMFHRAFDHYFGSLRGMRGFNDRVSVPLRSGHSVFFQPTDQNDLSEYMLPFRVDIEVNFPQTPLNRFHVPLHSKQAPCVWMRLV